ncbi:MAG TPA: fibronectin type III domain-containing protein, partial [Verrucomicrobiae bacterium]|nr:fibronectin type III domain-containing protein [Verrucomicrobiae bacterium]
NYVGISPYSNIGSGIRQAPVVNVGGTIATDTVWASGSHYIVTSSVTISAGATLTIGAGVNVCFDSGTRMTVANGGRLLAVGTSNAPILFTRSPSNTGTWVGLTINGAVGSPETRIEYARFEFTSQDPCIQVSAGTVFFDHLTFGNTADSYLHVDGASFIVQNCVFPDATSSFEIVHGTGGIKSGGHAIFQRNYFGKPIGYNDVVDFSGGNRPGPIVHFINNVFGGATDDELDLDGTDAWVEGNIFLHTHKNGSPDTASGVSGGPENGQLSDITVIGNLFYDCDHAAMAKGGNFSTLINNTVVHQTKTGGTDSDGAIIALADEDFSEAAGTYLEGNIFYDAEKLTRFYTNSAVTFTNNIFPANLSWTGAGGNNTTDNPDLTHIPQLSETFFSDWASAQVMKDWFRPQPGSPAIGSGPNGRDKGGVVPIGVSISGEPNGSTTQSNATLTIGLLRTGNGIPNGPANFPLGSGYTHYKWRLDGGTWSAETPMTTPIVLNNLSQGPHYVEVTGKRDSGLYQDDPRFGADAVVTRSKTWTVGSVDTDGDGMPDSYEIAQGFDRLNSADAQQDADGDGAKNLDEYLAGTDPRDANSKLALQVVSVTSTTATLRFTAVANKSYTIQYRDSLGSGSWQNLVPIPSQGTTHTVTYPDNLPPGLTSRFYRLVSPSQ